MLEKFRFVRLYVGLLTLTSAARIFLTETHDQVLQNLPLAFIVITPNVLKDVTAVFVLSVQPDSIYLQFRA